MVQNGPNCSWLKMGFIRIRGSIESSESLAVTADPSDKQAINRKKMELRARVSSGVLCGVNTYPEIEPDRMAIFTMAPGVCAAVFSTILLGCVVMACTEMCI